VLAGGWAAALAATGFAAWALRRRGAEAAEEPSQIFAVHALGIAAGFLASPTTWVPHLSLAAVPLAFVLARAWQRRTGCAASLCSLGAALLLFLPLGVLGGAESQRPDILAKLDGCVLLLVAVLLAMREPAVTAPEPGGERPAVSCPR
jgi:hypothetical protein